MILNNYWAFKRAIDLNYFHGGTNEFFHYSDYGVKDVNGDSICLFDGAGTNGDDYNTSYDNARLNYENNILIGTGDNSYEADAYCLVNDITSSFSFVENSITGQTVNGKYKRIITVSGENTSGSSKTITELAFCRRMYYKSTPGWTDQTPKTNVMLIVEPLEESITVPAGEGFIATMEWETIQDEPVVDPHIFLMDGYVPNNEQTTIIDFDKAPTEGWYNISIYTNEKQINRIVHFTPGSNSDTISFSPGSSGNYNCYIMWDNNKASLYIRCTSGSWYSMHVRVVRMDDNYILTE